MQNTRQNPSQYQRGGRPQYRYQRWAPPPEPKPEPKLDLSDKSFPSLPMSNVPLQTTGGHDFQSSFTTKVKVMAELEKLQELREQRERETTQRERAALKGVYVDRFQHRQTPTRNVVEPEEDDWRPVQEPREPTEDDGWTEVRHSKAHRTAYEKSTRELEEDYRDKAADEDAAEEYNGDLFDRSHRHDHYAT